MREREGLIARIRQIRGPAVSAESASASTIPADVDEIQALKQRMAHLEQMVEGLQDSVHRESERQARLIAELEARIQPAAMGAALDKDARDRGLS